jgi:hypothetical protein
VSLRKSATISNNNTVTESKKSVEVSNKNSEEDSFCNFNPNAPKSFYLRGVLKSIGAHNNPDQVKMDKIEDYVEDDTKKTQV